MSLTDTFKNTLSALTEGGLNRYRLDIPSCTALLDVETFTGKEFISELYHYQVIFTSSDTRLRSGSRYAAVAISGAAAGDDAAGTDGGGNGGAGAAAGTGYAHAGLSP